MDNNRQPLLLIGSNAIDNQLFNNNNIQGLGFIQTFSSKASESAIFANQQLSESFVADFDISAWLNENNTCTANVNSKFFNGNSNNNEAMDYIQQGRLDESYFLDDIMDEKAFSPASSSGISSLDTPLPSPLSGSIDLELESFLNEAVADQNLLGLGDFNDDLSNGESNQYLNSDFDQQQSIKDESISIECNDLIPETNDVSLTNQMMFNEVGSPDSGFLSNDESLNQEMLLQLLNQSMVNGENDTTPETFVSDDSSNNISFGNSKLTVSELLSQPQQLSQLNESSSDEVKIIVQKSEKRPQPYKRKPRTEDQKTRKKAQNRNAAVRYRSKKKTELQLIMEEEEKLASKNKELHGKVNGLKNEVDYLKTLMLDVIKVRLEKDQTNSSSVLEMLLKLTSSA